MSIRVGLMTVSVTSLYPLLPQVSASELSCATLLTTFVSCELAYHFGRTRWNSLDSISVATFRYIGSLGDFPIPLTLALSPERGL